MMKTGKKFVFRMLAAALLTAAMGFQSFAATGRIAFSDPSTSVGEEVTVNMKFSSTSGDELGNTDVMLSYDPTLLEYVGTAENVSGGTGKLRVIGAPGVTEVATQLKFKALRAGTASITVDSWEGYDNAGQMLTEVREGSSSISIKGLETSSTDATLQSLQVSPGTLTPAFTPATETYSVTVGLDTDRLTISAVPNNDHATVSVEGGSDLQEGENTAVCKVTAEDGTTVKNYTISISKVAGGETQADPSAAGETEAAGPSLEVLAELNVLAKKLQITALPENVAVPDGLKESTIAIGDTRVVGWTPDKDGEAEYCVFYGMIEDGEPGFYRYDRKDKTVQRYFDDGEKVDLALLEAGQKYNDLVDDYNLLRMIAFVAGGALLVLVIVLLVLLKSARSQGGRPSRGGRERESRRSEPRGSARGQNGRKMSKEERYMMGEEEDYEENEDYGDGDGDAYEEAAASRETESYGRRTEASYDAEAEEDWYRGRRSEPEEERPRSRRAEPEEEDFDEPGDPDDFEFYDLDDDK